MKEHKFNTLAKAYNYLRDLKKKIRAVKKSKSGSRDVLGVTQGGKTNDQRMKYLTYCISLLSGDDYPHYSQKEFHVDLLTAMLKGFSLKYIANMSGCSMKVILGHEREAMLRVQDAIERTKKRKMPIFEGVAH